MQQRCLRKCSCVCHLGSDLAHGDVPVLAWWWAAFAIFSVLNRYNGAAFLWIYLLRLAKICFCEMEFSLRTRKHSASSHLAHTGIICVERHGFPGIKNQKQVHLFSLSRCRMTSQFLRCKLKTWVLDYENEVSEEPQSSQSEKNWIVFQVCVRRQRRISVRAEEDMHIQKSFWISDFIIGFLRQFSWYVTGEEEKGMHLNLFCKFLELWMNSRILLCHR